MKQTIISIILFSLLWVCMPQRIVYGISDLTLTQEGGTFYDDVPESETSLLGAAQYFHIFANKANLRNHTNGNVATKELSGDANFGTKNMPGIEYHYAQRVHSINGASGMRDHTKMVFGKGVNIDLSEFNRPKINGRQMDRVSGHDIFQDKGTVEYIDFDKEFRKLDTVSRNMAGHSIDKTYFNKDFKNENERDVDITDMPGKDIYIKLAPEVLQKNTPLNIFGLEKELTHPNFKNVFIVVDTGNNQSYTSQSQIIFHYTDGTRRGNEETTDFSDSTVLWTFANGTQPFEGFIQLRSTWLGTILAPRAGLSGEQNIDGSIIVDEFGGAGETHRWDWNERPDTPKGSVKLVKQDDVTSDRLSGATFDLYEQTDKTAKPDIELDKKINLALLMTNAQGELTYDNLPLGHYYFVETKAPDGYSQTDEVYPFSIEKNQISKEILVEVTNTKIEEPDEWLGEIELTKVDDTTNQLLKGAEFSLYKQDGTLIKERLTTNDGGKLSIKKLKLGQYYFVETKAPKGYDKTDKTYHFEITKDYLNKVIPLTITNAKKKVYGSVLLTKTDQSDRNHLLGNATFDLYTSSGQLVAKDLMTDSHGELHYNNLIPGNYYFKETKAPDGYELSTEIINFNISSSQIETVKRLAVTNAKIKEQGSVTLRKVSSENDDLGLQGAEFSLYDINDKLIDSKLTTNEVGELKYDKLDSGDYYFIETKAPKGYDNLTKKYEFRIEAGQTEQMVEMTITNTPSKPDVQTGSVRLLKKGNSGATLQGAEFALFNSKNQEIDRNLVTNINGELTYTGLLPGEYYFVETKAPAHYLLDDTPLLFEINDKHISEMVLVTKINEVVVPDKEKVGSVVLTKVASDDSERRLSGALFNLYTSEGYLIEANLETDKIGQLMYSDLKPGNYYFLEVKAPDGFRLSREQIGFSIAPDEETQIKELVVTNEPIENELGNVMLHKVDKDTPSIVLQDAEFSLVDALGNPIAEHLETDASGNVYYDNLEFGEYAFIETKAPKGYVLDSTPLEFSIDREHVSKQLVVTVTNKKEVTGSVTLVKKDNMHPTTYLKNAVFSLFQAETNEVVVSDIRTDEKGRATVSNLPIGRYYIQETQAPEGYILSDKQYSFNLTEDVATHHQMIEIENVKIPDIPKDKALGSAKIVKVDAYLTNKVLKGAQFSLYKKDGILVKENVETNDQGEILFESLEIGDYYVVETRAPKGYLIDKKPINIHVVSNGLLLSEALTKTVITNKPEITPLPKPKKPMTPITTKSRQLPRTNEISSGYVKYIGFTMLVMSGLYIGFRKR